MESETDVVVIGAGPGGYSTAIRLAQAGLHVTCVEREEVGGVCLNWGCIPSKALITVAERYQFALSGDEMGIHQSGVSLDPERIAARGREVVFHHTKNVETLLGQNGVRLVRGQATLDGPHRVVVTSSNSRHVLTAQRAIVLATGASPRVLAGFEPDEVLVRTARSAVFADHIPEHLIVLGGGVIGLELGSAYHGLGSKLTVVEMGPQLLPGVDPDLVRVVQKGLEKGGARLLTGTRATHWEKTVSGVLVHFEGPEGHLSLEASEILVAAGFVPHTAGLGLEKVGVRLRADGHVNVDRSGRTSVPHIFALGDLVGPPYLAHKAYAEANVVSEAVVGKPTVADFRAMPAAIFTHPEIATVGLSETEARKAGRVVTVGKFPFSASGRAQVRGQGEGFVKLIAENGYLVGAGIVGPEASELIAELALAIEVSATLEDLALTVHPHPTLTEAIHDAADHALGRAVHIANRRVNKRGAA